MRSTKKVFHSVLPIGYKIKQMQVVMLATNKYTARRLYEVWNGGDRISLKELKSMGLEIRKVEL